mgnify:CR=1 FL=1
MSKIDRIKKNKNIRNAYKQIRKNANKKEEQDRKFMAFEKDIYTGEVEGSK